MYLKFRIKMHLKFLLFHALHYAKVGDGSTSGLLIHTLLKAAYMSMHEPQDKHSVETRAQLHY